MTLRHLLAVVSGQMQFSLLSRPLNPSIRGLPSSWPPKPQPWSRRRGRASLLNSSHPRYASYFNFFGSRGDTAVTTPPPTSESVTPVAEIQSTDPTTIAEPNLEFDPSTTDAFDPYSDLTWEVDEHVGYLKELGLDYGWGTTSMMQWTLEHLYIYSGLPWGISIVCIVAGFRLLMLPGYIVSNDMSAKFAGTKHLLESELAGTQAARASGDRNAQMMANQKLMAKRRELGLRILPMGFPILQIPIGFGTFRLLRGMGSLPVPGFDTAGFWWFTDLTLPDPLFILPICTSLIYFVSFKYMTQTAEVASSASITLLFRYVMPIMTLCFSVFFPSSLQISLFTTAFFTAWQTMMFRKTWFRQTFKMYPLKKPSDSKEISVPRIRTTKSTPVDDRPPWGIARVRHTFKQAWRDLVKQTEQKASQQQSAQSGIRKRTEAEMKKAKQYEERRRQELARRR